MIEAAATKTSDGKVWAVPRPERHSDVFEVIARAIGYDIHEKDQTEAERERWLAYVRGHVSGFVTDEGVFLDREQAFDHAHEHDQFGVVPKSVVVHAVHGRGRVLRIERAGHPVLGRLRVYVLFENGYEHWIADDELRRVLIGSILTSEDLWFGRADRMPYTEEEKTDPLFTKKWNEYALVSRLQVEKLRREGLIHGAPAHDEIKLSEDAPGWGAPERAVAAKDALAKYDRAIVAAVLGEQAVKDAVGSAI